MSPSFFSYWSLLFLSCCYLPFFYFSFLCWGLSLTFFYADLPLHTVLFRFKNPEVSWSDFWQVHRRNLRDWLLFKERAHRYNDILQASILNLLIYILSVLSGFCLIASKWVTILGVHFLAPNLSKKIFSPNWLKLLNFLFLNFLN